MSVLPYSRPKWPAVSVINNQYPSDIFNKRHRLNPSLIQNSIGNKNSPKPLQPIAVNPQRFKMRVKQLQIAQQFTPEYYLHKHLPTQEEQRAYVSPSPSCWSIKSPSVLSKEASAKSCKKTVQSEVS